MKFEETALPGAYIIHQERFVDDRGYFARTYAREEFEAHGLSTDVVHCSTSFNRRRGTLRGMHWQDAPYAEAKLIRCTAGAIHDVIVDLRHDSPTYGQHVAASLTASDGTMLYCPEGFAHGFLTLADDTEIHYQMSQVYAPEHARGARWDDPFFAIDWPMAPVVLSDRDRSYADLAP